MVEPIEWDKEPPPDAVFIQAQASSNLFKRATHSLDDLTQEVLVQYYAALERRKEAASNGIAVEPIRDYAGFIHVIARRTALATGPQALRAEDRRAMQRYEAECTELQAEYGRPLTRAEEDQVAADVIESMPPRRRPTAAFHRQVRAMRSTVSLDANDLYDRPRIDGIQDSIVDDSHAYAGDDEFAEGSKAATIERLTEEGGRANFAKGRVMAWDAIAEQIGKPQARPEVITERRAADVRRIAKDAGGADQLVDAWRNETISEDQADALFAPFGGSTISFDDQCAVVEAFDRCGIYGPEAWDSAVTASTKKRSINSSRTSDEV